MSGGQGKVMNVADSSSSGIRSYAAQIGATKMEIVGRKGSGDSQGTLVNLLSPTQGKCPAIITNADPIIREGNEAEFDATWENWPE